jgi:DNA-binding CsgD family transcriptional regulator
VAVLIIDAASPPPLDPDVLQQMFSLTAAEARLAGKLALGWSIEEIATESGISIETVRTHIKRVLSKTATSRQGELISLVLRSVPFRAL